MTKFLLSCLAASTAASAMAINQIPAEIRNLGKGTPEKSVTLLQQQLNARQRMASPNVKVLKSRTTRELEVKKLRDIAAPNAVRPSIRKAPSAKSGSGYLLSEDFESWNGSDYSWLPEGWGLRHDSGREDAQGWGISAESDFMGMMGGLTGNCLSINYDMEYLDEWILFPEVTLGPDMILSFDAFNDGVWYFSMNNVDWNTYQYIGEKQLAFDQQVMISEDGGQTWTLLKSLAEDFMHIDDFLELLYEGVDALRPVSISLAEYSGKTVKLAFRYVGADGNTSAIDNITIGNPPMQVSYLNPFGNLFCGMSKDGYTLNFSLLTGPVYRDMTFINYSDYVEGAEFSWDYFGPESTWLTADTQDYLDVMYHTDYTDESTTVNNLYYMPVLNGSAPGFSEGSFTRGRYLQAGGKGQFLTSDKEGNNVLLDFGLTVVDPATESSTTVSAAGQPIFGYADGVDEIWTRYTFGDDFDENNYVKLDAYMDYFMTSDSPIVINGIHSSATGSVKEGVRFKAEIVPLSDEGVILDTPIAVAECGYSDLGIIPSDSGKDFISLNFTFDKPVVMSADVCPAYLVRISGFNDAENVEFFSPILSAESNPDEMALGWIQKTIVMEGQARTSTTPIANYVDEYLAFYIMLDAEFPWLEGPESVGSWDNMVATATLDSSFPGEELSFENLPGWLSAKAEGQYGNTTVKFYAAMTDEIKEDTDVTVTAPGVSHVINVKAPATSGISGIEASNSSAAIYNLSGARVSSTEAPGIYIVKDASGKTRKVTK